MINNFIKLRFHFLTLLLWYLVGCQSFQPISEGEETKFVKVNHNEVTEIMNSTKTSAGKKPAKKSTKINQIVTKWNKKDALKQTNRPKKTTTNSKKTRSPTTSSALVKKSNFSTSKHFVYQNVKNLENDLLIKHKEKSVIKNRTFQFTNRRVEKKIIKKPISFPELEPEIKIEADDPRKIDDLLSKPAIYEGGEVIFNGILFNSGFSYNYSLSDYENTVSADANLYAIFTYVHAVGIDLHWTPYHNGQNLFLPTYGYDLQIGLVYDFRIAINFFTFSAGMATGYSYFLVQPTTPDAITHNPNSYYLAPKLMAEFQILNFLSIGVPVKANFFFGSTDGLSNNLNRLSFGLHFAWRFID